LAAPDSSAARIPEVEASVRNGALAHPATIAVATMATVNTINPILNMCLIWSSFCIGSPYLPEVIIPTMIRTHFFGEMISIVEVTAKGRPKAKGK
jgi:hypothetical protein